MYLVFTRMPGESYRRRLRSLLLHLCDGCRALIISLVCRYFFLPYRLSERAIKRPKQVLLYGSWSSELILLSKYTAASIVVHTVFLRTAASATTTSCSTTTYIHNYTLHYEKRLQHFLPQFHNNNNYEIFIQRELLKNILKIKIN